MTPPTQSGERTAPTSEHREVETQPGPAQPPTAGGPAELEGLPAGPYKWRRLAASQRAWAREYDLTPLQAQEMAMWL